MGVFRSEKMLLCQVLFSQETVYDCIEALGNIGLVQFRDFNQGVAQHQRRYVGDIRRCEEMERKIRIVEEEIRRSETPIRECKEIPPAPGAKETLLLETNLETLVAEMGNVSRSSDVLERNLVEFVEHYHVLKKASIWLEANNLISSELSCSNPTDMAQKYSLPVLDEEKQEEKGIGHLKITTGVINVEKVKAFEVLVWRVCRVAFVRIIHFAATDADLDFKMEKAVFVIICQGDSLCEKIRKICEAFHCNLYLTPPCTESRRDLEKEILTGIRETQQVLHQTEDHWKSVLHVAAMSIEKWRLQVLKLKSIYHVMNMLQLDEINEFQMAECWVPQSDLPDICKKLNSTVERVDNHNDPIIIVKSHDEEPPTFNRTNKFTKAFQSLVDAYGVSEYCEVNPMPYTVVTFPFLFAVMFGDVGHGIILSVFAIFIIFYEGKLQWKVKGEIQRIFFEGRYVILLMGIFSCYTGLIYNDFFSKSVKLFPSSWRITHNLSHSLPEQVELDPGVHFTGRSYVFGIDPIWQCSANKITFLNSFKMKISITIGVLHMCFGLLLGAGNHLYFGKYSNIYTSLIPEIIYFVCLFVYLVFLIFAKWILYGPLNDSINDGRCAPNILLTFINMIMFKASVHPGQCSSDMYPFQGTVQTVLVTVALLTIPWLFTAKAAVMLQQRRSHFLRDSEETKVLSTKTVKLALPGEEFDYEKSDVGEIIIHQGIRTIEFVLGSISHTASYLRLWALSLAHAQLSDVLWKMVLRYGIAARGNTAGLTISICFAIWASLTVGILVIMEGLSAFLHTLRLHWVEFQSKFYSGCGRPFRPFSFDIILHLGGDVEKID